MCRWVAYRGKPVFLSCVVTEPRHSLIHQSVHATEAKTVTNGDGFGLGWYGEHDEPGLYKELRPAWGDENLLHLARQIRSRLFFAHVRAATGTATSRSNCHPFAHGQFLFMHNGQIGGYHLVRRALESMIPDELYAHRTGTTDSEAIFLASLARHEGDPVSAVASVLKDVVRLMSQAGIKEALRFTAVMTDGADLWAFRTATDTRPPTLYWRESTDGIVVVSEPLDEVAESWKEVPKHHALVARADARPELVEFRIGEAVPA